MRLETAIGKLRGSGHKLTPQRLTILEAVAEEQHQSMADIRNRCPRVGMVTVYRTLNLLSELGIIRRIELGDGPRYELATGCHHHLICEGCGNVVEFERCPLDRERLPEAQGFEVSSHSLEIYGLCASCR